MIYMACDVQFPDCPSSCHNSETKSVNASGLLAISDLPRALCGEGPQREAAVLKAAVETAAGTIEPSDVLAVDLDCWSEAKK
jgi:hypothetical protein